MFKKESHRKANDTFHYIAPKLLDDQGVNDMVAKIGCLVQKIRKVFDGRIVLIGPLPRMIAQCCQNKAHQFQSNPLFNTNLQYAFLLNKFLAVHYGMNLSNFDFVTYDMIFGNIFNEMDLKDGVHLTKEKNIIFAEYIARIPAIQVKKSKHTFNPNPSFLTWVEGIKMGAKNLFSKKAATKKTAGAAEQQPERVQASDSSPLLRQAPQKAPENAMETDQTPGTSGQSKAASQISKAKKAAAGAVNRLRQAFQKPAEQEQDLPEYSEITSDETEAAAQRAAEIARSAEGGEMEEDAQSVESSEEGEVDPSILDNNEIYKIPDDDDVDPAGVYAGCVETGDN